MSHYLECRERFRLHVVEGIKEDLGFNHAIEYGSTWHEAEEADTLGKPWRTAVQRYTHKLLEQWPTHHKAIGKWEAVCLTQFPIYKVHWHKDPDTRRRKYFLSEKAFKIPYTLPSGRTLILRGKIDAAYQEGKYAYTQENKTKGKIDILGIERTLVENLQTMTYWIAYHEHPDRFPPAKGLLYNIVRRPLSDNRSIRQRKTENLPQFLRRLGESIQADPDYFFFRRKVSITKGDVAKFKKEVFHPILEGLLDWWDSIKADPFNPWTTEVHGYGAGLRPNTLHYRSPWGCYNSLSGGFRGSYFDYLTTGNKLGLETVTNLFPELT